MKEWTGEHTSGNSSAIISDANFETAIDFSNPLPNQAWFSQFWLPGSGAINWAPNIGRNGSGGISVDAAGVANDIAAIQKISLNANKFYRVTGWAKTENVAEGAGANICLYGTWYKSDGVMGTTDWQMLTVTLPPNTSDAMIGCRLGYWSGISIGKAFFDDLVVTEQYARTGKRVQVVLDPEDASAVQQQTIVKWVSNLDQAYLQMEDLMGGVPDSGKIITVLSVSAYPGGWAVAGNPILWYEPYIKGELQSIQSTGTWSFGIMHEIGHDFVLQNSNTNWIFNEEMFANFRFYYAVEKLNASILEGKLYQGAELENYYKTDGDGSYANGIAIGVPQGYDGVMYTLLRIKDKIGWTPYKQAMADLNASSTGPGTKWSMFNLLLDKLNQYSGQDVRTTYLPGELNTIEQLMEKN
jgi:hypothetical protein